MNYGYNNYDSVLAGLSGGILAFFIFLGIILLTWGIVAIIALLKVYKKAGKKGWECIIPIYSYYVLAEIAGLNWWWFLLAIADSIVDLINTDDLSTIALLISLFAKFNIYYNIAKKFNKNNGTAVCAGIFSGIFILIFGFSKSEVYDFNAPVSKNGVFETPDMHINSVRNTTHTTDTEVNNQDVQQFSFCGNCGTKLNKDVKFCPNCERENK